MELEIRPLRPADRSTARELAAAELANTPYAELPSAALGAALEGGTAEAQGLAAVQGDEVVGIVVFGFVAGATRTGRLHLVAVTAGARLGGVASALIDGAIGVLAGDGARVAFIEIPGDARLQPAFGLLERGGFTEEGRVADYFRDGVPLVLLRRDVG